MAQDGEKWQSTTVDIPKSKWQLMMKNHMKVQVHLSRFFQVFQSPENPGENKNDMKGMIDTRITQSDG